jgi:hypothetical protein
MGGCRSDILKLSPGRLLRLCITLVAITVEQEFIQKNT